MHTRLIVITLLLATACTSNPIQSFPQPQDKPVPATNPAPITETTPTSPPEGDDGLQKKLTEIVVDDLAARLSINAGGISVISAEALVWPDAALGCPTDRVYAPEKVPGFQIRLEVNKKIYVYHTDRTSQVILCSGTEPYEPGLR